MFQRNYSRMNHTVQIIFSIILLLSFSNCNTTKNNIPESSTSTSTVSTTSTSSIDGVHFEKLTYNNFDELMKESEGLRLAYFWATWCGPCRTIAPALDNISRDYSGRLTIGKLNVDAEKITADLNGIRAVPSFLFFRNGELVFRTSGLVTEQYLINVIDRLL